MEPTIPQSPIVFASAEVLEAMMTALAKLPNARPITIPRDEEVNWVVNLDGDSAGLMVYSKCVLIPSFANPHQFTACLYGTHEQDGGTVGPSGHTIAVITDLAIPSREEALFADLRSCVRRRNQDSQWSNTVLQAPNQEATDLTTPAHDIGHQFLRAISAMLAIAQRPETSSEARLPPGQYRATVVPALAARLRNFFDTHSL